MAARDADSSGDQYAEIARALSREPGVTATLELATSTAVEIVDGCDHAGISLVRKGGRIETVAPTGAVVSRLDELQLDVGEGPSLQSIAEHETVDSPDLTVESRWPRWAPEAARAGVRSVLAMRLFVGARSMGALNLYSAKPDAFESGDRVSALALAAHVAVAMTAASQQDHLDSALVNRTVIGQAEDMPMQALGLPADQAFAALARASQTRNVKLHLIAADIVRDGVRPELWA